MKKIKENEQFQLGNEVFTYQIVLGKYSITKVKGKVVKPDFIPPTLDDVKEFFKFKGYTEESGLKFHEYYDLGNWHDGNGKPIKNWKQKASSVWFRDENKIKSKDNTTNMIR